MILVSSILKLRVEDYFEQSRTHCGHCPATARASLHGRRQASSAQLFDTNTAQVTVIWERHEWRYSGSELRIMFVIGLDIGHDMIPD